MRWESLSAWSYWLSWVTPCSVGFALPLPFVIIYYHICWSLSTPFFNFYSLGFYQILPSHLVVKGRVSVSNGNCFLFSFLSLGTIILYHFEAGSQHFFANFFCFYFRTILSHFSVLKRAPGPKWTYVRDRYKRKWFTLCKPLSYIKVKEESYFLFFSIASTA